MSLKHKYKHIHSYGSVEDYKLRFVHTLKRKSCVCAGDILKANDDLSRVISSYKHIVEGQPADSESEVIPPAVSQGDSFCISHMFVFTSRKQNINTNLSVFVRM